MKLSLLRSQIHNRSPSETQPINFLHEPLKNDRTYFSGRVGFNLFRRSVIPRPAFKGKGGVTSINYGTKRTFLK